MRAQFLQSSNGNLTRSGRQTVALHHSKGVRCAATLCLPAGPRRGQLHFGTRTAGKEQERAWPQIRAPSASEPVVVHPGAPCTTHPALASGLGLANLAPQLRCQNGAAPRAVRRWMIAPKPLARRGRGAWCDPVPHTLPNCNAPCPLPDNLLNHSGLSAGMAHEQAVSGTRLLHPINIAGPPGLEPSSRLRIRRTLATRCTAETYVCRVRPGELAAGVGTEIACS